MVQASESESQMNVVRPPRRPRRVILLGITLCLVAACQHNTYVPPPPLQVTVAHPIEREVTTYNEFTGRTVAIEAVEVRARVQGYLQSVNFVPGSEVKEGDLLFVIEPGLYEARAQRAQADLQGTEANLRATEEQLSITKAVFERNAGSRADMVQRTQARDQASAAVAQAKAALAVAQLDLSYTKIFAPISGRIDRNFVDVGNLVGAGEPTLLTSIVRQDPIYAYFDVSERDVLAYRALIRKGQAATAEGEPIKAEMALASESGFPHEGSVNFASNRVDPSTGTMELRAVFPNTDRVILPGLFVRVRLPVTRGQAMLVPEEALGLDQGGRYLLAVDAKNIVQIKRVEVGAKVDGQRVVHSGISTDDWIVVSGLQRARPGAAVKPQTATENGPHA